MSARLSEVLELYRYDDWATDRVLAAAATLSHEQLTRDVGGSFPSVLATLAHILHADWIWLSRWQGASPTGWPTEWRVGDFATLRSHRQRVTHDRNAWLAGLREDDLDRRVHYRNTAGEPLGSRMHEMLRHVVNHASYHRGQVTSQLRAVGGQPVATDLIVWFRERDSSPAHGSGHVAAAPVPS